MNTTRPICRASSLRSILARWPTRRRNSSNPTIGITPTAARCATSCGSRTCVDIVLWFLENPQKSGLFNCGTGQARSFADLACAVYHALGKEPLIEYRPTPEAIRARYQYFTEAAMDRLFAAGFARDRLTSLEDGVTQYVQGYLSGPDPYR